MPPLPGVKAGLEARCGIARCGAVRIGGFTEALGAMVGSTLRPNKIARGSFSASLYLNGNPSTASMTFFGFVPTELQEVVVYRGYPGSAIFGGTIMRVSQSSSPKAGQLFYACSCVDWVGWVLRQPIVFGRYTMTAADTIVLALLATYAPSFVLGHVIGGAPSITIEFHGDTLAQALDAVAKLASWKWWCSPDKSIYFFTTDPGLSTPVALTTSNYRYDSLIFDTDASQVRTAAYVLGKSTRVSANAAVGAASISVDDNDLFGEPAGYGATWGDLGTQYGQTDITSVVSLGGDIALAGTFPDGKILRSTGYGTSWADLGQQFGQTDIPSLASLGSGVALAGTYLGGKILRSTDYGKTWTDLGQQYAQTHIWSLANVGGGIALAGTFPDGKILRSTDYGATWADLGTMYAQTSIRSLVSLGGGIVLAGTAPDGKLLRSTDSGATWADLGTLGAETYVLSLASLGGGIVLAGTYPNGKIFRSIDSGATWTDLGTMYTETSIRSLVSVGGGIAFAGTGAHGKMLQSTDSGATWSNLGTLYSQTYIRSLASLGGWVALAGTGAVDGKILRIELTDLSYVFAKCGPQIIRYTTTPGSTSIAGIPASGVGSIQYAIKAGDSILAGGYYYDPERAATLVTKEGGTGIHANIITDGALDVGDCIGRAVSEVNSFGDIPASGTYITYDQSTRPGQLVTLTLAARAISGTYIINQVDIRQAGPRKLERAVKFSSALIPSSFVDVVLPQDSPKRKPRK